MSFENIMNNGKDVEITGMFSHALNIPTLVGYWNE
jgi:hypothetical protein